MDKPKPTRGPDYASPYGCYYWFEEMVFADVSSIFHEIALDHHNRLVTKEKHKLCGKCLHCIEDHICEVDYFADHIQKAYGDWWYQVFESKFLGEE